MNPFADLTDTFGYMWLVNLLCMAGMAGVSAVYRRAHGKPVLFFGVQDSVFQERRASGNSTRSWFTRLGGARNALVVAVTRDRLVVRPFFPFTLLFLPEIYGLEYEVPLRDVMRAEEKKPLLWTMVHVEFRDPASNEVRKVILRLRDPKAFVAALQLPPRR
jgi:hypothetical protein